MAMEGALLSKRRESWVGGGLADMSLLFSTQNVPRVKNYSEKSLLLYLSISYRAIIQQNDALGDASLTDVIRVTQWTKYD